MQRIALLALIAATASAAAGCKPVCGTYDLQLPETETVDDRFDQNPVEFCNPDYGSQGGWEDDGVSYITFQPDERGMDANFVYTNMLIVVNFRTGDIAEGATLSGDQLSGEAFYGLARPERSDQAWLVGEESSITFHGIGEETGDGLYRDRLVDTEWDLVWRNGESRWAAEGRKDLKMLRESW